MCMRVYMRVYMIVRTPPDTRPAHHRNTEHHRNTPPEKGGFRQSGKPAYIGKIADDEKKYKKS